MIEKLHKEEFGVVPQVVASAPGLVCLFGEFVEYCDGHLLIGALNRRARIAISPRTDNSLRFYSADLGERKKTTIPNLKYRKEDRWANNIKGILYELNRRNYNFKGLNITIQSDIPTGMGFRSTTAVATATMAAMKALHGYDIDDRQMIETIYFAKSSFLDEHIHISDIMAMLYAKEDELALFDMKSLEHENIPAVQDGISYVITNSNVPVFVDHEETIRKVDLIKEGLEFIKERIDIPAREINTGDIQFSTTGMDNDGKRFCMHIIEENRRAVEASRYLKNGEFESFGRYVVRSYESLRDNFAIYSPETDWLIKRALEMSGCYSSQLMGVNFGGCVLSIIDSSALNELQERFSEYEHIFGFASSSFIFEPSSGVLVEKG